MNSYVFFFYFAQTFDSDPKVNNFTFFFKSIGTTYSFHFSNFLTFSNFTSQFTHTLFVYFISKYYYLYNSNNKMKGNLIPFLFFFFEFIISQSLILHKVPAVFYNSYKTWLLFFLLRRKTMNNWPSDNIFRCEVVKVWWSNLCIIIINKYKEKKRIIYYKVM